MTEDVVTDVVGEPFTAETIQLKPDLEGEAVATLVRLPVPGKTKGAVLYVHGFSDYFFQRDLAQWWVERGYEFYALDLRKYGRSLRPHQTPAYVNDLTVYDEEINAAWDRITQRDGHQRVIVMAHSTGGLVLPLWADRRQPSELAGLVLNSPWLDMQGSATTRLVLTPIAHIVARFAPMRLIPREVSGLYTASLHHAHQGEWDFDLDLKPLGSFPITLSWFSAIRRGHSRVHRGLRIGAPTLVLSSGASTWPTEDVPEIHTHDIVLDVEQIKRWAPSLGSQVTYAPIEGALHDVVLSAPAVREKAYATIEAWLNTSGLA